MTRTVRLPSRINSMSALPTLSDATVRRSANNGGGAGIPTVLADRLRARLLAGECPDALGREHGYTARKGSPYAVFVASVLGATDLPPAPPSRPRPQDGTAATRPVSRTRAGSLLPSP